MGESRAAVPFFQHATELDPVFAMAYDALGSAYSNLSKNALGDKCFRKAFELKDHTSESERFQFSGDFCITGAGQLQKTEFRKFMDHRGLIAHCPLGALAHLQLGRAYAMAGDTAKLKQPTKISLPSGKMPTPTSPS